MLITQTILGIPLCFETAPDCFSPQNIDRGTLAMLEFAGIRADEKVLDLGCGYGVVGIMAAKITSPDQVTMLDINEQALTCARKNAVRNGCEGVRILQSNAFESLDETGFDIILSNPPYHSDFSVPKAFIEKGFNRLRVGGRFLMVTKRLEWYKQKFLAIFGGVKIHEQDGYFVFVAEKRSKNYKR